MNNRSDSGFQRVDAQGIPIGNSFFSFWNRAKPDPVGWGGVIISAVFFVLLLIGLGLAINTYFSTQLLYKDGIRAEASVVDHQTRTHRDSDGNRRTTTRSVLQFLDNHGNTHQTVVGSQLPLGSTRTVIFTEAAPAEAKLVSENPLRGPGIAILIVVFLMGLVLLGGMYSLHLRSKALNLIERGTKVMATIIAVNNRPRYSSRRYRRGRRRRGGFHFSLGDNISVGHHRNREIVGYSSEVIARWRDPSSGSEHTFRSYRISDYVDPSFEGKLVPVFINPADPEEYYLSDRCFHGIEQGGSQSTSQGAPVSNSPQPDKVESDRELSTSKRLF